MNLRGLRVEGRSRAADRRGAILRCLTVTLLGVAPLIVTVMAINVYRQGNSVAFDFHRELFPEARLVLHGHNPYPPADADLSQGRNNVWPVAAVLPVIPLTFLPAATADWSMTALVLGSLVGAIWVLGVRDWRVYAVTLLWPPVISAYQTANLTLPLCLLCAIIWRARRRVWLPGIVLGLALAAKFFLWPLALWLAAI